MHLRPPSPKRPRPGPGPLPLPLSDAHSDSSGYKVTKTTKCFVNVESTPAALTNQWAATQCSFTRTARYFKCYDFLVLYLNKTFLENNRFYIHSRPHRNCQYMWVASLKMLRSTAVCAMNLFIY